MEEHPVKLMVGGPLWADTVSEWVRPGLSGWLCSSFIFFVCGKILSPFVVEDM